MQAIVFDPSPLRWPFARIAGALARRWRAGRLAGLTLCDIPDPPLPRPDWVRLRPILGGICGTDLALVTLRNHPATVLQRFVSFPAVLGHENVAVIDAVGPAVTNWKPGQRVCVEPSISCRPRGISPLCPGCANGCISLCENTIGGDLPAGLMIGLNSFTSGSWSEAFVAHESQLFGVPDSIPDEHAVVIDAVSCALHAVLRRSPVAGETILINGGGALGIGIARSLRALGAENRVVAIVRHRVQADMLRASGANEVQIHPRGRSNAERFDDVARLVGGRRVNVRFGNQALVGGFDVVYDCIGTGSSLTDSLKWARARGTVIAVGTSQIALLDTTPLWLQELTVIGCSGRQYENWQGRRVHTYEVAFELALAGKLKLDGLLTHTFPLKEYRTALACLLNRNKSGAIKVAFRPK